MWTLAGGSIATPARLAIDVLGPDLSGVSGLKVCFTMKIVPYYGVNRMYLGCRH